MISVYCWSCDLLTLDSLLDRHPFSGWNKIRHVRYLPTRRARGDHKTGAHRSLFVTLATRFRMLTRCPEIAIPQAKRFAKAMHAPLIFSSTSASINVQKIFKIVLAKAFDLKCVIPEIDNVGEPVLLYVSIIGSHIRAHSAHLMDVLMRVWFLLQVDV